MIAFCLKTTKTSFDMVTSEDDATALLSKIAKLENLGKAVCSQEEFGGEEQLKKGSTLQKSRTPVPGNPVEKVVSKSFFFKPNNA